MAISVPRSLKLAASFVLLAFVVGGGCAIGAYALAQGSEKPKVAADKKARKAKPAAAIPAPAPLAQEAPSPANGQGAAPDFAAQLAKAGAGTCRSQVDALSARTMGGVAKFNVASHWSSDGDADKRAVSVFIGQGFDNAQVPYGAAGVVAAPSGKGACDAVSFQVVPSPLPCAKLREALVKRGAQAADLAGVQLMREQSGDTMLVPTGGDACVLVGLRTAYAK